MEKVESISSGRPDAWAMLGHRLQVEDFEPGIADGLSEDKARLGPDRGLEAGKVARRHETGLDAEARQRMAEKIDAAAIERRGRHDMAAGAHQGGDGKMQCAMPARGRYRADPAFEGRDPLLEHGDGGIGDARIDVADALEVEQRRRRIDVAKHIGGRLIDGHGPGARRRVRPLSRMKAESFEFVELGVGHPCPPCSRLLQLP